MLRPVRTAAPVAPPDPSAPPRSLSVALTTEGTYPFHEGGVSTWCDQLLRGMDEHTFDVYAVLALGDEPRRFDMPGSVRSLRRVALWGDRAPMRHRQGRWGRSGRSSRGVRDAIGELVAAIASDDEHDRFLPSLRAVHAADPAAVAAALTSDLVVERTVAALARMEPIGRPDGARIAPSLTDAVRVLGLLDHLLRPLHAPSARVDLVHASSNGLAALTALGIAWRWQAPLLLTEHGVYLRERYIEYHPAAMPALRRMFLLRFHKQLTRAVYRSADAIAPGSEYNRRWEIANGADLAQIVPIHNGVDADAFAADLAEPAEPTIVWVGRVDPLKDLKTMLQAFALVVGEVPDARLRIVGGVPAGNEWYHRDCLDLHQRLGLGDRAVFEGRVDDIADAYQRSSIVVSTSISEGFPYSVIEAMASGRAMVATDVGGVREAVAGNGVLVAPQDARGLADACVALLRDHDRRRALASAGRERVRRDFQLSQCTDRHRRLYLELVGDDRHVSAGAS